MLKRLFDIVVSLCVLVGLLPLFAVIAVVIVMTDGLPVLFRQQRVGRGGDLFTLYKFRSMSVQKSAESGQFDAGNVSRVTPIGRIIRKTKLDEFPQFFNVLMGHMSIVGPRPEVQQWTTVYPERWARVLSVRPGITDNASIIYRDEESILASAPDPNSAYRDTILPHKLSLYEDYIDRQSFLMDIRILVGTVLVILGGKVEKI